MTRTHVRFGTLLVAALLLVSTLAGAAVAAETPPNFRAYATEKAVTPGATQQVTVELLNTAQDPDDEAEMAQNVEVWLTGTDAIEVRSGRRFVGDLPRNMPRQVPFALDVPANVSSGVHELTLHVRYEYQDGSLRDTDTTTVKVEVPDRPRFRVVRTDSTAPIGDTGSVNVTLENVGSERATDASLTLTSTSPDVRFSQASGQAGASATRYVGAWDTGETRTFSYQAIVGSSAERRPYSLTATVNYDDPDGDAGTSRPMTLGVTPGPEQSFSVSKVTSSLQAGEEGYVTATVTNDGPETARAAVVRLSATGVNVHPQETEFAAGTLAPGDSTKVRFPIEISDSADGGPRQLGFTVAYENRDGDDRQSDTLNARVDVAPSRDAFAVEPKDAQVTKGGSVTYTIVVTNQGNQTVSSVNAKAFVDSPLSSSDDEAFIPSLDPGESQEIDISVSVAGSALTKTYPLSVDFQYDQPDGDTKLSDTYQLPVTVTESEDSGGFPVGPVVGAVVVIVLVGGVVLWRRRG